MPTYDPLAPTFAVLDLGMTAQTAPQTASPEIRASKRHSATSSHEMKTLVLEIDDRTVRLP